ncbi:MAG: hypothetical protein IT512_08705 [Rhodocyclaceae bacterium]|nr:hypothetical protein [Rhodocyclaceae bacterium]
MHRSEHDDVTLIVRECGERTVEACIAQLAALFPGQPIHRISNRPFVATLRASLQQGLADGRTWTLCIDADVLVLPALRNFIAEAKRLPAHFAEAQALVADKLLPARRPAGNHLYRSTLIPKALASLPDSPGLRPESAMVDALVRAGHPYHQSAWLIGLHDFGQAPADVYDKAALHGHKHAYLGELLLPLWQGWSEEDEDYRIALQAFLAASHQPAPAEVARHRGGEETGIAPAMSTETMKRLLDQAPHRRPEAAALRRRIEGDVFNVMAGQRQQYELTLPFWRRWLERLRGGYPYFPRQPGSLDD